MAIVVTLFLCVTIPAYLIGESLIPEMAEMAELREAESQARQVIRGSLKYPRDAEFVGSTNATKISGNRILVTGAVKAANGIGLKLTYDFNVILKAPRNGIYQVENISFDPPMPGFNQGK